MTMSTDFESKEQGVVAQRDAEYGDGHVNHERLGKLWTTLLEHYYDTALPSPIPAHIACLMMTALKVFRASAKGREYNEDDFIDLRQYASMARESKARLPKFHTPPSPEMLMGTSLVARQNRLRALEEIQSKTLSAIEAERDAINQILESAK